MRVLVITQKIDKNDDLLGFFHEWVRRLSGRADRLNVICLEKGAVFLPEQIGVFSLGKERGRSRLKYVFNFYRLIWRLRKEYDSVFVHMNPGYVLLGGWFWRLWGKKIFLWYNHRRGGFLVRVAVLFATRVFYTSPLAFTARFARAEAMPAGIDLERFRVLANSRRIPRSILYLGRISPIKNVHLLVSALEQLDREEVDFSAVIYGSPPERDRSYYNQVVKQADFLTQKGRLSFRTLASPEEASAIYNQYEIFVNLTPAGSFDKTVLEAMACGNIVLASNQSFSAALPENLMFVEGSEQDLAEKIKLVLQMQKEQKENYQERFHEWVVSNHSLDILINRLALCF